jgi:hypothetical protein
VRAWAGVVASGLGRWDWVDDGGVYDKVMKKERLRRRDIQQLLAHSWSARRREADGVEREERGNMRR